MSFETTKRELGELYAFIKLLADGEVSMGNPEGTPNGWTRQVCCIERMEHDGYRRYHPSEDEILLISGTKERNGTFTEQPDSRRTVSRSLLRALAPALLQVLRSGDSQEVEVPDEIEQALDTLQIFDLEAHTDDRTDFTVTWDAPHTRPVGMVVRSRLGSMNPLLDGGRTANLKLEQSGIKFATPTVNKINALPESPDEVCQRMLMIERLGGVLKYADVADRVFRANLSLIDLHFPRLLTEMLRLMHLEGITRISQLTERMEALNPLKIKEEFIEKHSYYRHKVKQFLLALALGMRPAKIYNGRSQAIGGLLLVQTDGSLVMYDRSDPDTFADFLYQNSRFLKGDLEKDKYGFLERENGKYYFKLNAKVGLLKR